MATHFSSLLAVVFVTLTFAGPIPSLVPLAAVGLGVRYLVDKAAVLRLYAVPKQDLVMLATTTTRLLRWGSLLALAGSMWAFSDPDMFSNPALFGVSTLAECTASSTCSSLVHENGGANGLGRLVMLNVVPIVAMFLVVLWTLTIGCPVRCRDVLLVSLPT